MNSIGQLAGLAVASLLAAGQALAAERLKIPSEFDCPRAVGSVKLDGKADEPAWEKALIIESFVANWASRPGRTRTKARLMWDDEYLYFHAEMQDADLYADIRETNGNLWENDVFELFFRPSDSALAYYEFQVNVRNTIFDCLIPRRGHVARFMKMHEFGIESAVVLRGTVDDWTDRDQGWSVELRIPWTSLAHTGGRPEPGDEWRFALCRYDYDVASESPELSTSAPLPVRSFHGHEHYEPLRFEGPAPTADNPPPTPGDAATSLVPATVRHPTPT